MTYADTNPTPYDEFADMLAWCDQCAAFHDTVTGEVVDPFTYVAFVRAELERPCHVISDLPAGAAAASSDREPSRSTSTSAVRVADGQPDQPEEEK